MPIYEYKCKKCGNQFEIITSFAQKDKVTCSKCDSKEVEQLISGCSVNNGSKGFAGGSSCGGSGSGGG
jgi:putative FmdB family regulatory protein